jgi:hypothetical protein
VSVWPRARPPVDPRSAAILAELDQVIAELRAAGLDRWVARAEGDVEWVQAEGADSVVLIRLSSYRNVLRAAAG